MLFRSVEDVAFDLDLVVRAADGTLVLVVGVIVVVVVVVRAGVGGHVSASPWRPARWGPGASRNGGPSRPRPSSETRQNARRTERPTGYARWEEPVRESGPEGAGAGVRGIKKS